MSAYSVLNTRSEGSGRDWLLADGDPDIGAFADAAVLFREGDVPNEISVS